MTVRIVLLMLLWNVFILISCSLEPKESESYKARQGNAKLENASADEEEEEEEEEPVVKKKSKSPSPSPSKSKSPSPGASPSGSASPSASVSPTSSPSPDAAGLTAFSAQIGAAVNTKCTGCHVATIIGTRYMAANNDAMNRTTLLAFVYNAGTQACSATALANKMNLTTPHLGGNFALDLPLLKLQTWLMAETVNCKSVN